MKPLTVMIVDDEPLARERIRTLLESEKDVRIIAECANGAEALRRLQEHPADLLFLDIHMPEMDGIALAGNLPHGTAPLIIFTTAYDSFAVKAFELQAVDYLLKPFTGKRFRESLQRIRTMLRSEDADLFRSRLLNSLEHIVQRRQYPERIVVKADGKVRFLPVPELRWVESDANYLRLHTAEGEMVIRETMTRMAESLDPELFVRLHRTVLVNASQIKELKPWMNDDLVAVLQDGTQLPIGRTYKRSVLQHFKL